MAACPNATLVTHHKGAPHMIDPSRLQKGATEVYGEDEFQRIYGDLEAIDESRVTAAREGDRFALGEREILFIETPGHANHHGCFFETETRTLFTGDTFGLSYREFDSDKGPMVIATTTPVAFDPDAWGDSLDRMLALQPLAVCPTHFGRLAEPLALVGGLRASVEAHRRIALDEESEGGEEGRAERLHHAVDELLVGAAREHQPALGAERSRELLQLDIDLNAQGLHVWLKRRARNAAA
jgi:glyoxylase-like metal-dependent hydrolase (beta-lactamase superfamily II)